MKAVNEKVVCYISEVFGYFATLHGPCQIIPSTHKLSSACCSKAACKISAVMLQDGPHEHKHFAQLCTVYDGCVTWFTYTATREFLAFFNLLLTRKNKKPSMENVRHIITVKSDLMANFSSKRQGNGALWLGFYPPVITTALDAFQKGDFCRASAIE